MTKYEDQIKDLQSRTFDAMNRLRYIKEVRNNHEMRRVYRLVKALVEPHIKDTSFLNEYDVKKWNKKLDDLYKDDRLPSHIVDFIKPFGDGEHVCYFDAMFSSLLTSYKLDRLFDLKKKTKDDQISNMIKKLIINMQMSDYDFDSIHLKDIKHPILDFYMRIDVALPDGKNFHKCYINEIEPLASGKGEADVVLKYLNDAILGEKIHTSITANILVRAYQGAIRNKYINFDELTHEKI